MNGKRRVRDKDREGAIIESSDEGKKNERKNRGVVREINEGSDGKTR